MTTPRPQLPGQPSSRPDQLQPGPDLCEPGLHPARLPVLPPFPRQPGWPRPLPDVVAVRRLPLPDSAPPYDDQQMSPAPASRQRASAESGRPETASPEPASPEPASPAEGQPGQPGVTGQQGPPPPGGPAGLAGMSGSWPSQFAQVLAEALAGARPAEQLTSWTTQRARNRIRRLGPVLQTGPRPRVMRVLGSAPARDVVELTIILSVGSAVRALAVRLERAGPVPPARGPDGPLRGIRHQAGRQPGGPGSAGDDARGPGLTWLCTDIEAA